MAFEQMRVTDSFPLEAHDVPDETRQALTAVRVLVAAAAKPGVHLSVPGLADATGLSVPVVVELLASDLYKQMVLGTCKQRCSGIFQRGITRLEEIVEESEDAFTVMAALDSATKLYKTISNDSGGHAHRQSRADEEELIKQLSMQQLSMMNRINDSTSSPEPAKVAAT